MPPKARSQSLLQNHRERFVQGIEQVYGGEDTLWPLQRSATRRRLFWLRLPGEKIAIDGATRFAALLHHGPGTVTHCHIGMPDGGPDGLMVAAHGEVNIPGVGGQVSATQGRHGIEKKQG